MYDALEKVDLKQFPHFHKCTPIKVIQEAGETIYGKSERKSGDISLFGLPEIYLQRFYSRI